jgi:hypothetical protein
MVERGPEKAGVGGSIPSLGINLSNELQAAAFSKRNPFSFLLLFCTLTRSKRPTFITLQRFLVTLSQPASPFHLWVLNPPVYPPLGVINIDCYR